MQHVVTCRSTLDEDAEVDVDLHDGRADVALTGVVGPRATSVLRTVLEALDGMPGPVALDCVTTAESRAPIDEIVDEARRRRRRRGLADVVLTRAGARAS